MATFSVSAAGCANCGKLCNQCNLKRCSGCKVRFYCSAECSKANWKDHKVECKQAQDAQKVKGEVADVEIPFEGAILDFEAMPFTESSFQTFIDALRPIYILDASQKFIRTDLNGVTERGYLRLNALAIRAIHEFPHCIGAVDYALLSIESYLRRFCSGGALDNLRRDMLLKAKDLEPLFRCLRLHIANPAIMVKGSFVVANLTNIDHAKFVESLGLAGLVDISLDSLKLHPKDASICRYVLRALSSWMYRVTIRRIAINFDKNALILPVLLVMKRFQDSEYIQANCCRVFYTLTEEEDRVNSSCATTLVAMGAFELTIRAIQGFPSSDNVVKHGSLVLKFLSTSYFRNKAKVYSTDACAAIVECIPNFDSNPTTRMAIIVSINDVISQSPASVAKFIHPASGVKLVSTILRRDMNDVIVVGQCVKLFNKTCLSTEKWDKGSSEYLKLIKELSSELWPLLIHCIKKYMHQNQEVIIMNAMGPVLYLAGATGMTHDEVAGLFKEAIRVYPSVKDMQTLGNAYLAYFKTCKKVYIRK